MNPVPEPEEWLGSCPWGDATQSTEYSHQTDGPQCAAIVSTVQSTATFIMSIGYDEAQSGSQARATVCSGRRLIHGHFIRQPWLAACFGLLWLLWLLWLP